MHIIILFLNVRCNAIDLFPTVSLLFNPAFFPISLIAIGWIGHDIPRFFHFDYVSRVCEAAYPLLSGTVMVYGWRLILDVQKFGIGRRAVVGLLLVVAVHKHCS